MLCWLWAARLNRARTPGEEEIAAITVERQIWTTRSLYFYAMIRLEVENSNFQRSCDLLFSKTEQL